MLADLHGVHDATDLRELEGSVVWRRIMSGHVPQVAEPGSPRIWMVVFGGLRVQGPGSPGQPPTIEEIGPGGIVHEDRVGWPGVVAVRDTLIAGFPPTQLHRLAATAPELFVAGSMPIVRPTRAHDRRASVIAVVVAAELDRRYVVSRLAAGLEPLGHVEVLWPARVDVRLSRPGIAQSERGEVGDLAVARLLCDLERSAESVVLEVGAQPDAWSRRALAAADRVAVVAPGDGTPGSDEAVRRVVDFAPPSIPRHLVLLWRDVGVPTGTAVRLDATGCQYAHHVEQNAFRDVVRVTRLLCGRGRGLVLSGGGARGFAHLGVHRALHELGIEVDVFAGSSIGSPLAATMADGMTPDQLEPLIERLFARVLDYTVPVVALTSGRRIAAASAQVFGERDIEDLRRGFVCVSTDLTTARPHVHHRGSIVHAIRSSCAIPGVMPPVPHEGHLLVDGGVTNNLPVDLMRELSPGGEVIAVDVVPPSGPRAREDYGLWVSGIRALHHRVRHGRTLPAVATTIMRALTVASDQQRNVGAGSSADCHLEMDLRGVSMLDFGAVRSVAQRGYDQAMPALEGWLASRRSGGRGEEDDHGALDAS